ncbi:hypothetical protein, partial [Escherichia sp. E4930]|uniref:hypothetical protein n=1 Tax=Escherichia sp. E4930 TaxID=2044468 RepID=UPI00197ACBF8
SPLPDATLAASYQAYNDTNVGQIRRLRRIRLPLPDATLTASYQAYNDTNRRSDKAFTPHPTCFPSN